MSIPMETNYRNFWKYLLCYCVGKRSEVSLKCKRNVYLKKTCPLPLCSLYSPSVHAPTCVCLYVSACAVQYVNNMPAFTQGALQSQSERLWGYSHAVSSPSLWKPSPRGCRQTPGTSRHSRAYLFNRMCYSITASLSQQQSFKYPFISGILDPRASEDHQDPVYLFGFAVGLSLWFIDTGGDVAQEEICLFFSVILTSMVSLG